MGFFRASWNGVRWLVGGAGWWGLACALAGALAGGALVFDAARSADRVNARNDRLRGEIAQLDKQVAEIKAMRDRIDGLQARRVLAEKLGADRQWGPRFFTELSALAAEGAVLTAVSQNGARVQLDGRAARHEDVSELLKRVSASTVLQDPRLLEVRTEPARLAGGYPVSFSLLATARGRGEPGTLAARAGDPR